VKAGHDAALTVATKDSIMTALRNDAGAAGIARPKLPPFPRRPVRALVVYLSVNRLIKQILTLASPV